MEAYRFKVNEEWRNHLDQHGFVVIANVIDDEKCDEYDSRFWDWLEAFGTGISRNDPSTWKSTDWPGNIHGIFQNYAIGQQQFVWDIRCEDRIIDIFEKIYSTRELLVSFDGATKSRPEKVAMKKWPHIDQGSDKIGFHCAQGFLNLVKSDENGGGLIVYDGSHLKHESFIKNNSIKTKGDWHRFDEIPEEYKDCKQIKVCCEKGDVVLWDSRTIHYAAVPDKGKDFCRTVVYVCYQPRSLIGKKDLNKKIKAFNEKRVTSHWPSQNIKVFPKVPRDYAGDGRVIDRFPFSLDLPTLDEKGQRLAGLISY